MTNTDICPFCETIVKTCDKAICCDLCDETGYCNTCIQEILPFCNKKINPNKINLGNVGIDPNLKKN